jgi:hypothetical protein
MVLEVYGVWAATEALSVCAIFFNTSEQQFECTLTPKLLFYTAEQLIQNPTDHNRSHFCLITTTLLLNFSPPCLCFPILFIQSSVLN